MSFPRVVRPDCRALAARLLLCIFSASTLGACASDPDSDDGTRVDSGTDTAAETGTDASTDTGVDPSSDVLPSIEDVIFEAGQTEDDARRFELLDSLLSHAQLDDVLRAELEGLLPLIDQWGNGLARYWMPGDQPSAGEGGYLAGFFHLQVWPSFGGDGPTVPARVRDDSPLYPIWALYRGRMLIWSGIQTGTFVSTEAGRESWYGEGRALLSEAASAFPDNRVIRMYLDEPIPWAPLEVDPNAPEWATLQREALNKITDIIEFWIDERQAEDGQFGGGWGDDVEMWRWWTPVLVGFEYPPITEAQARLSDAIFELPRLAGGYSSILTDVEHSAEDSSDAISAMLLARPGDAAWEARADRIAELARDRWMARNDRGLLQFQSTYFTAETVSTNEAYACDTFYHVRALQPVLHRWQSTGDEATGELIADWLDTWVDAARSEARGKPAGVLPSALHWPSGEVGGPGSDWWDPGCAQNADAFDFPGALSLFTQTLVLAWHLTDDDRYLEPLRSMAEVRRTYVAAPPDNVEEGSVDWIGSKLSRITDALVRYRAVSGDPSFDDLILARANGYVRYRLTGDSEALLTDLARTVASLRVNREAYTTEVRYTDRVRKFAGNYANHYAADPLPTLSADLLYEMVSGDLGAPLYFPQPAVRWTTSPRDFTAWVTGSSSREVEADVYVFGDVEREVVATFPGLEGGSYEWGLTCDGEERGRGSVEGGVGSPYRVEMIVPAGVACELRVEGSEG